MARCQVVGNEVQKQTWPPKNLYTVQPIFSSLYAKLSKVFFPALSLTLSFALAPLIVYSIRKKKFGNRTKFITQFNMLEKCLWSKLAAVAQQWHAEKLHNYMLTISIYLYYYKINGIKDLYIYIQIHKKITAKNHPVKWEMSQEILYSFCCNFFVFFFSPSLFIPKGFMIFVSINFDGSFHQETKMTTKTENKVHSWITYCNAVVVT